MCTQLSINAAKVVVFVFALNFFTFAQITSSAPKGRDTKKTESVYQAEAIVNQVTDKAGVLFKEGLLALKDQKKNEAGEKFNKALEVFMLSAINVRSIPKLSVCYDQLIETIYHIEFPETQPPDIRALSVKCGWNWNNDDYLLADEIVKFVQPRPAPIEGRPNTSLITSADGGSNMSDETLIGFNEQVFEPSPLDNRIKLQLTSDDIALENLGYSKGGTYTVKARSGDTVAKVAERYGASPIQVAKFNGLYTNSKLADGREIKIPGLKARVAVTEMLDAEVSSTERENCQTLLSPIIQDLKFGMKSADVSQRLGGKLRLRNYNPLYPNYFYDSIVKNSKGVDEVFVGFYKSNLFRIIVAYDHSMKWQNDKEFLSAVSKSLGLPNVWVGSVVKELTCKNFSLSVKKDYLGRFQLSATDTSAFDQLVEEYLQQLKIRIDMEEKGKKSLNP